MLSQWIRSFYNDNGSISDFSTSVNPSVKDGFVIPIIATEDYIYISQYFPFNNFYLEMDVVNDQASNISIQYWTKREWKESVDIIDGTKVGSNTLARSGVIQFSPDIVGDSWNYVRDPREEVVGFGPNAYGLFDQYWIRLKFSGDLKATTKIKSIGYAFTTDLMLQSIDPEIDQYLEAWGGVSKVDWIEQIIFASLHVLGDLKVKQLVFHPGNILRFDDVALACAYKTLINIYSILGESFNEKRERFSKEYTNLLNIKRFTFDTNQDGKVNRQEISTTYIEGVR